MRRTVSSTTTWLVAEPPPVKPGQSVGAYLLYPHETHHRIAEGGLRTTGQFKQRRGPDPVVSIVTVVRNCASTLERCITSVLEQTYANIEYIIVDGGSTDGTLEIIDAYADSVDYFISEADSGLYHAMNKGLSLASGDYIAFLNADDYYLSAAVSASVNHIRAHDLDVSYACFQYTDEHGNVVLADEARPWDESMLIQGIPGGHETVFAHRHCYEQLGGFDTSYKLAADYEWVMRAYKAGFSAKPLARPILVMATGGVSFDESTELAENIRLLREHFGELPEALCEELYKLKFYRNWYRSTLEDAESFDLYSQAQQFSDDIRRALFLTIENRKHAPKGIVLPSEAAAEGKLKIAICLTYLTGVSGGAERIAVESANELARRGHAVTVVSCHGRAGEPYYRLDERIPYIDLAIHPYKQHFEKLGAGSELLLKDCAGRHFDKLNYELTEEDFSQWCNSGHGWRARMYGGFFTEHRFDLVVSHMPSTFPYVLLSKPADDPALHIACLHNAPEFKFYSELYPSDSVADRYMRLMSLERADKISVIFDAFTEQMPAQYQSRCFTLPNFTNIAPLPGSATATRSKTILTVGRLVPQKDHATLIKSYAKIRHAHPDWKLRIFGDGPLKEELARLCRTLGMEPDDILKEPRPNIERVYEDAAIFAFPSLFEGFGLTLIEAMAFGLPVVGFAECEGVKYLIDDGNNGLFASRESSVDSLADAINRLIESPQLRVALGEEGKRTAARYNVGASVDALERVAVREVRVLPGGQHTSSASDAAFSTAIVATYLDGGAGIAAKRLHRALLDHSVHSRVFSFSQATDETMYQARLTQPMQALYGSLEAFVGEENRVDGSTLVSSGYPGLTFEQLSFFDNFDIINLHWVQRILSNEAIGWLASRGKTVVWTMHDMNPFTGGCHYSDGCEKYQTDCRNCAQLIDTLNDYPAQSLAAKARSWPESIVLVSPSRWLAECAKKSRVFKNSRVEVIPNSLDIETFSPISRIAARAELNLPTEGRILLFTSYNHKEKRKGFTELLQAAEMLRKRGDEFHIITFGNETRGIAETGFPVTALGYVENEATLALGYNAADVTVLPTLEDNLPNVILESISCGTPVAAFDSGGVRDGVIDGVTGYLAPRGDIGALANRIARAANEDLRETCRAYAVREYSPHVQAQRYRELYEELLDNPGRIEQKSIPEMYPETAPAIAKNLAVSLGASREEVVRLKAELNHSAKEVRRIGQERMRLQTWINEIEQSTSWRITRPLRAMKLMLTDNRKFRRLIAEWATGRRN